jgi:hypothetical protein
MPSLNRSSLILLALITGSKYAVSKRSQARCQQAWHKNWYFVVQCGAMCYGFTEVKVTFGGVAQRSEQAAHNLLLILCVTE